MRERLLAALRAGARLQRDADLHVLVASSQDDTSEAIVLLCPGHGGQRGRAPTIEGETLMAVSALR